MREANLARHGCLDRFSALDNELIILHYPEKRGPVKRNREGIFRGYTAIPSFSYVGGEGVLRRRLVKDYCEWGEWANLANFPVGKKDQYEWHEWTNFTNGFNGNKSGIEPNSRIFFHGWARGEPSPPAPLPGREVSTLTPVPSPFQGEGGSQAGEILSEICQDKLERFCYSGDVYTTKEESND